MSSSRPIVGLLLALVAWLPWPAHALTVVATLPYLGELAHRLAPEATVITLAKGTEDPHYLSPTPALMAQVGKADVYIENGLNLELWSERLLDGAGNPRIRPGQPGYIKASDGVPRLEVPTELTRAQGDLHPEGNPHIWLDPLNVAQAADNVAAGLGRVDPANAAAYVERAKAFRHEVDLRLFGADLVGYMGGATLEKLARAGKLREYLQSKGLEPRLGGWLGAVKPGQRVVYYHLDTSYLNDRFGVVLVGTIEDRPGVAPSAGHKERLAADMKAQGCTTIGVTSYYDDRIAVALGQQVGARVVKVPGDIGGVPQATDYFTFIDSYVDGLLK